MFRADSAIEGAVPRELGGVALDQVKLSGEVVKEGLLIELRIGAYQGLRQPVL
jgi:hypothetical protein